MKNLLAGLRSRLWLRHKLLAAAALGAGLLALGSYELGALSGLERQSIDARFSIRGTRPPRDGIVIVGLDERTLRAIEERPPIRRVYYAELLDRLHADHPRLIGIDAVFTGRTDREDDDALLRAIARDGPVLLGTEQEEHGEILWPVGVHHPKGAVLASLAVDTDPDNVLRRMLYAPITANLPTFAVRAAEMLRGHPLGEADFPGNHAWVDFRGPPGTFPKHSFIEVLDGHVPASAIAGKVVLVGITDPLEKDVYITAISPDPMSGVEFHANALQTVLEGFPLQSLSSAIEIALLFALAAIPALLSLRLTTTRTYGGERVLGSGSLLALAAVLAVLGAFLLAAQLAFDGGTIVSVPDPILALVLGTAAAFGAESFVQRRQLQNLQEFFDRLPSPVSEFFISYRRTGSESVAHTLRELLSRKFGGDRVFMDTEAIEPGDQFPDRIAEAIAASNAMLVVIGPHWLDAVATDGGRRLDDPDDWVVREIAAGLARADLPGAGAARSRAGSRQRGPARGDQAAGRMQRRVLQRSRLRDMDQAALREGQSRQAENRPAGRDLRRAAKRLARRRTPAATRAYVCITRLCSVS